MEGGYRAPEDVNKQLVVLNNAFSKHNIEFKQVGLDYTFSSNWTDHCNEINMKKALHKGT